MRYLSLLLFFLLSFVSCDQISQALDLPGSKERIINKITKQVALKLKKEYDLYPCGSGGQAMNEIKMLALSFDYYKPIDIEQSRELLITAVTEFVDAVNENKKIRPYLYNYPFEPKNVEIRIFLYHSNGSEPETGELTIISSIDGILKYKTDNSKSGFFTIVHRETFQEALEKVKS